MSFENIGLDMLAMFAPNKETLHRIMVNKGYYLPLVSSKTCSEEYLLQCLRGQVFCLKTTALKPHFLKDDIKAIRLELYNEIKKLVKEPLGYELNELPEKGYLIDLLNSLDNGNKLFKNPVISTLTRELKG